MITIKPLSDFLSEYVDRNIENKYPPVAVGRYGIRTRESIYSKELAKDYSKNKLIRKNTLTVGMGSNQVDIGILSDDKIYSVSPAYHTYNINGINVDYLRYCLEHRNQDMFIRYAKRGSRQGKTIDFSRWLNYVIPVYSEEIQSKIVIKLNKISFIIRKREELLKLYDQLVRSLFIEMFGDPISNPKEWKKKKCKNILTKIGSGATPQGGSESYKEEGISLIRSMNVHNGRFESKDLAYIDEKQAQKLDNVNIKENDVLINITGASVARCCIVPSDVIPARVNQHVSVLRCSDMVNSIFLCYQIINDSYQNLLKKIGISGGATREAITKKQIEDLEVILPPLELQNKFANFVRGTDKSKLAVKKSLEELEILKKSLMQKYFA